MNSTNCTLLQGEVWLDRPGHQQYLLAHYQNGTAEMHPYTTNTSKQTYAFVDLVMHMLGHDTGVTVCPLYPHSDETMDHPFHCPHPVLKCKWEQLLEQLQKKGLSLGIP
jgi:hypothetical protein